MYFNGYKRAVNFAGTTVLVTLRIPYDDAHLALRDSVAPPSHAILASRSRSIFVENIEHMRVDGAINSQSAHTEIHRAFSAYSPATMLPYKHRFVYRKNSLVNLQQLAASVVNVHNGPCDSYVFFYLSKEAAMCDSDAAKTIDQAPYHAILAKAHRTPMTSVYLGKYWRDRPVRERRPVKRMKL
jgi:hypothetical protein